MTFLRVFAMVGDVMLAFVAAFLLVKWPSAATALGAILVAGEIWKYRKQWIELFNRRDRIRLK